jgi:hypothetical protein
MCIVSSNTEPLSYDCDEVIDINIVRRLTIRDGVTHALLALADDWLISTVSINLEFQSELSSLMAE